MTEDTPKHRANRAEFIRDYKPGDEVKFKPAAAVLYQIGGTNKYHEYAEEVGKILESSENGGGLPTSLIPCYDGSDLTAAATWFGDAGVSRLVLIGGGSPEWFMRPGQCGLHLTHEQRECVVSVRQFSKIWASRLADGAVVSLAADSCSQSPKWYRNDFYRRHISPWTVSAYSSGGQKSLAQALASRLCTDFLRIKRLEEADESQPSPQTMSSRVRVVSVRGHTTAGHHLYSPMLRSHSSDELVGKNLYTMVRSTFQQPGLIEMRKWQKFLSGGLALNFLLGMHWADVLSEACETIGKW